MMTITPRARTIAAGLLLAAFGFVCGFFFDGSRRHRGPAQPPPQAMAFDSHGMGPEPGLAVAGSRRFAAAGPRHRGETIEWHFDSNSPGTTVIVVRDGELMGPDATAIASPAPPRKHDSHAGLWLALLLLSGLAPLTWYALTRARARTTTDPLQEHDVFPDTFVPRRDD
jgi:hypothetical protein